MRRWWAWLRAARAAARQRTVAAERRRLVLRALEYLIELGREDLAARLIEEERYVREAGERWRRMAQH